MAYEGLENKQIAHKLGLTRGGVHYHWAQIHKQLGTTGHQRYKVFAICIANNWLAKDDTAASLVVVFRDLPEALGLTRAQRIYCEEFDAMLRDHQAEDEARCAMAFELADIGTVALRAVPPVREPRSEGQTRPRPGNNLDGFWRKIIPVVCRRIRPVIDPPFGDRGLVTDLPLGTDARADS